MLLPDLEKILTKARCEGIASFDMVKTVRNIVGYSAFDDAVEILRKQRLLNPDRDKREKPSRAECWRLYKKQNGVCPICNKPLHPRADDPRNVIDHIDPNRQDFNSPSNKQLVHDHPCNSSKSGKSIQQQSKESGQGFTEIIEQGIRNASEDVE